MEYKGIDYIKKEIVVIVEDMGEIDCLSRIVENIMLDMDGNLKPMDSQTMIMILNKHINALYEKVIDLKYYIEKDIK